jgi:SnoaL-like domain
MDRIGSLAEKRDIPGLLSLLTDDYADFEGRDRAGTADLVADHFRRRYGIVVHLLHTEIAEVRADGTATVRTDVVLSSGGAEILRKLVRFAGEFYRFELELRKTPDGWRVARAEWAASAQDILFPESLPVLRELFPGAPEFAAEGETPGRDPA